MCATAAEGIEDEERLQLDQSDLSEAGVLGGHHDANMERVSVCFVPPAQGFAIIMEPYDERMPQVCVWPQVTCCTHTRIHL
jgi:hypothetical protein